MKSSPAPTSRITHEYFIGMRGMCHGPQGVEKTDWISTLIPSSSNDVRAAGKPIPTTTTTPKPNSSGAVNHLSGGSIGHMWWGVIFFHGDKGSKMLTTLRFWLSTRAGRLLYILSPGYYGAKWDSYGKYNKYAGADFFRWITVCAACNRKHWPCQATHISYLNRFNMALSGISVRANCAEDNVSNNRLNPISQTCSLEVRSR